MLEEARGATASAERRAAALSDQLAAAAEQHRAVEGELRSRLEAAETALLTEQARCCWFCCHARAAAPARKAGKVMLLITPALVHGAELSLI